MKQPNQHTAPKMTDADYIAYYKSRCIITESGCWEWQGFRAKSRNLKDPTRGYPEGSYRNRKVRLNRHMIELTQRPLLPNEYGCHRCDNPPCINPDHLYPATQSQNKLDEVARGRSYYIARTHCPKGHPYDDENTYINKKQNGRTARNCKVCSRIRQRIAKGWTEEQANNLPVTPPGPSSGSKAQQVSNDRGAEVSDDFDKDLARVLEIRESALGSDDDTQFLLGFIDNLWNEYSRQTGKLVAAEERAAQQQGERLPTVRSFACKEQCQRAIEVIRDACNPKA